MSNTTTFTLTVLPTTLPVFLSASDTSLGLHHNRVPLGYVCSSATTITVRSTAAISLRFLNNNRNLERSVTVEANSSSSFTHNETYVPFADRVVGGDARGYVVECTVNNYLSVLPHYTHGLTDEAAFKNELRALDDNQSFAFLELKNALLLVPPPDKAELLALDLGALDNFYTTIVDTFDHLIGLVNVASDDPATRNFNKKYFCKADSNGVGAAYYDRNWTAQTNVSMSRYLQPRATNWLVLHEIGHAYDFQFVSNTPALNEVWNNVLADRYQYDFMSFDERQRDASVYENGNRDRVERNIAERIDNRAPYESWSFFQKMAVFTWMMDTDCGRETMARINRQFRQIKTFDSSPRYMPTFDWWVLLSDGDFVPYLKLMQVEFTSCRVLSNNNVVDTFLHTNSLVRSKRVYYPVKELIANFDALTNNYGFVAQSNYSLVAPGEVDARASLVIHCDIDDARQIAGQIFYVYDGTRLVWQSQIDNSNRLVVNDIHAGVYTMVAPRGRDKRYRVYFDEPASIAGLNEHLYLFADTSKPTKRLIYERLDSSPAGDRVAAHVLGINDLYRAKVIFDFKAKLMSVHSFASTFNSGYANMRYFVINVKRDQLYTFNHTFTGTQNFVGVMSVDIAPGDTMSSFHQQGDTRFIFLNAKSLNFTLNVSENWYSNTNLPSKNQVLETRMDECAAYLYANASRLIPFENHLKDELYLTIQSLPDKDYYMRLYNPFLPAHFKFNTFDPTTGSSSIMMAVVIFCFVLVALVIVFILVFVNQRGRQNPNAAEQAPPPLQRV